jgi:hypothetical protein
MTTTGSFGSDTVMAREIVMLVIQGKIHQTLRCPSSSSLTLVRSAGYNAGVFKALYEKIGQKEGFDIIAFKV